MSRISIHRSKKLTAIAKKKDDIAKHLESGNEVNAKIWVSRGSYEIQIYKRMSLLQSLTYHKCPYRLRL
jgi:hypothetical protein